jgi:hypothetical protein
MIKATISMGLKAIISATLISACAISTAEPPARVARLGYISGTVSFAPAGQSDWIQAALNRPVTTGDLLWVDDRSRAELQIGGAAIRLGAATSLTVLNLDDLTAQVQISQGSLKLRVRRIGQNQVFEVDTPNLAFVLRQPGEYRVDVDPNGNSTAVRVQSGAAEVYGGDASYTVTPRRGYRFYGSGLSDYDTLAASNSDDLDLWSRERDRRADNSSSARYVSGEVVGSEDLDSTGTWRTDPNYGNVWTPSNVPAGWTPYRDGRWTWVDPWGWTWVDDAPWGYAVSHYGRWANTSGSWGWVPGPPRERAVYAPALVVFVGGAGFQGALGTSAVATSVGWFPLAPREIYRPTYQVSKGYFDNINRSNSVIAPANLTNFYNTINVTKNTTVVNNTTKVTQVYANQQVRGAVVAVPVHIFAQSQPVAKAALPISKTVALGAPIVPTAQVAPLLESVHGGSTGAGVKPPAHVSTAVTHTMPPPPPVPFAAQQAVLAEKPGVPIDEARRGQLKPAGTTAIAPVISVQATSKTPPSVAFPPESPPSGKTPETRKVVVPGSAPARIDTTNTENRKVDTAPANAAKGALPQADASKPDLTKVDAAKAEAALAAEASSASMKTQAAKADATRANAASAAGQQVEAAKAEAAKLDAAKAEAARAAEERSASIKTEAAKADAARANAANAAGQKVEAAKAEAAKLDVAKAEAARAAEERSASIKTEAAKADTARANAANAASQKVEAAKAEAAKVDAQRAIAAKADAARANETKAAAAKNEALKVEAAKAEKVQPNAAGAMTPKAEVSKPDVAKPPVKDMHAPTPRSEAELKMEEERKRAEEAALIKR